MNILAKQFVDVVFDKEDWTCMGPYYENKTMVYMLEADAVCLVLRIFFVHR